MIFVTPKVNITTHPYEFVFEYKNQKHSLKTFLLLKIENTVPKIMGVGKEASNEADLTNIIKYNLFQNNDEFEYLKGQYLNHFILFGLALCFSFKIFGETHSFQRRSTIYFKNTKSLRISCNGFELSLLENAAFDARAMKCIFEEYNYQSENKNYCSVHYKARKLNNLLLK